MFQSGRQVPAQKARPAGNKNFALGKFSCMPLTRHNYLAQYQNAAILQYTIEK